MDSRKNISCASLCSFFSNYMSKHDFKQLSGMNFGQQKSFETVMCLSVGLGSNSLRTWCRTFLILTRYCYSTSLLGRYFKTQHSSTELECKKKWNEQNPYSNAIHNFLRYKLLYFKYQISKNRMKIRLKTYQKQQINIQHVKINEC